MLLPDLLTDGDHAAVVVPVLGIEVVGQHSELFNRIEIRNDGGAAIHVLLHIDSVHQEAVGRLPLAIDGQVPRIQITRRVEASGNARHDDGAWQQGRDRGHSRLDGQQVRVAPSIQRERGHLCTRYDLAEVSCGRLDLHSGVAGDVHTVRLRADRQCCIYS